MTAAIYLFHADTMSVPGITSVDFGAFHVYPSAKTKGRVIKCCLGYKSQFAWKTYESNQPNLATEIVKFEKKATNE